MRRSTRHAFHFLALAGLSIICVLGFSGPVAAQSQNCNTPMQVFSEPGDYKFTMPRDCDVIEVKLWGAGGGAGDYHDIEVQTGTVAYPGGHGGGGSYVAVSEHITPGADILVVVGCGGTNGEAFEAPSSIIERLGLTPHLPLGLSEPEDDTPIRLGLAGGGGQISLVSAEGRLVALAGAGGGGGAAQRFGAGGDGMPADQISFITNNNGRGARAAVGGYQSTGHEGGDGGDMIGEGYNGGIGTQYCGGSGGDNPGIGGGGGAGGGGYWGGGGGAAPNSTCELDLDGYPICESGSGGGGAGGVSFAQSAVGFVGRVGGTGRMPGGTSDPDWNGTAGIGGEAGMTPKDGSSGLAIVRFRNFTRDELYALGLN